MCGRWLYTHHRVLEEYVGLGGVDFIKRKGPQLQQLRKE